jgi:hypothetical protein
VACDDELVQRELAALEPEGHFSCIAWHSPRIPHKWGPCDPLSLYFRLRRDERGLACF